MLGARPEKRKYIVWWSFDKKDKKDRWISTPVNSFSPFDAEGQVLNSHHQSFVHKVEEAI